MKKSFDWLRDGRLSRAPAVRRSIRAALRLAGLLWITLFSGLGLAQQPPPPPPNGTNAVPGNRWLIIVETTKRMRPRAPGVQESIPSLVFSAMNGQMWRGDTLGVWTFNEELYAGRFALQEWTPGNSQAIALMVSDFLKVQKYEHDSSYDKVLPLMQRVIKNSDYITVLLVTDGKTKIQGTPFDDKINTFFQTWQKQQDKAHMPFIIALRAEHGQITNYAITIPPYTLDLPPLPQALIKRMVQESQPQVAAPRVVPSLIVHGKKSEPTPAAATTTSPVTNSVTTPASQSAPVASAPSATVTTGNPAGAAQKSENTQPGTNGTSSSQLTITQPKTPDFKAETPENRAISDPVVTSNSSSQTADPDNTGQAVTAIGGVEIPSQGMGSKKIIWIAAGVAVFVAFCFGFVLGKRSGSGPFRVSLVGRSSDQAK